MTRRDLPPGVFDESPIAPLTIGGSDLSAVIAAAEENGQALGNQRVVNDNRFWSSQVRLPTNRTREIYVLTLNTDQEINFISLELPKFPHRVWVQYSKVHPMTGQIEWLPMQDRFTKAPVAMTITESLPARFMLASDSMTKMHPEHYGAGHWASYRADFRSVSTSQVRLVMVRIPGPGPYDRNGDLAPYPLGVRNCYVGFDASDYSLIPRRPFVSETEHKPFASGIDALRSTMVFSLRENKASALAKEGVWRSAPQPVREAVVNLYLDSRDEHGDRQVIDRFFVDPLYTGPKVNLYYTDDVAQDPTGDASDEPVTDLYVTAGLIPSTQGIVFPETDGVVRLRNSGIRFDPSEPFWMGFSFSAMFPSTSTDDHVIFSCGADRHVGYVTSHTERLVDLRWNGSQQRWAFTYNGVQCVLPMDFPVDRSMSLVAVYDGVSVMLFDPDTIESASQQTVTAWDGKTPEWLVLGNDSEQAAPQDGLFRLTNMVVKNHAGASSDWALFLDNPANYVVKTSYPYEDDSSTNGAVLRYHDAYRTFDVSTGQGYWGFVGAALIDYVDAEWVPVNRDYESRRGFWEFNPVSAAAFKFEFFDLSPQPYDTQTIISRQTLLFPETLSRSSARPTLADPKSLTAKSGPGVSTAVDSALYYANFSDSSPVTMQREGSTAGAYSPTEALYAEDPVLAKKIQRNGSVTDYMRWHENPARFRFPQRQKHYYRNVEIRHDRRIAFFAGLRDLAMYRVDYVASDDTDQYLEVFHDDVGILTDTADPGYPTNQPLVFSPGSGLTSGPGSGDVLRTARSKTYFSKRKVRAIQFATTQSDPYQVLDDPDFDDPSLAHWHAVGDATISPSTTYNSSIGTTIVVDRSRIGNYWDNIEARYPTWDDIEGVIWNDLEGSASPINSGGVVNSDLHVTSSVGRLYAAARVFSPVSLTHPLVLQILGEDGRVLAEAEKNAVAGAVTEWYVGYTIGEGGDVSSNNWDDVEALYATWDDIEGTPWSELSQTVGRYTGRVTAQVIQANPSDDLFYVDNISLFDDPIVWEFTNDNGASWFPVYDIRNNPDGVFVFPDHGEALAWRVTIAKEGFWISAVDVRPQYAELPMGVAYREGIERSNGNVAHYDHYNPIAVDPRFRMWRKPIPEWWWFINRQWLLRQSPYPALNETTLPESIVATVAQDPWADLSLVESLMMTPDPPDIPDNS